MPIQKQRIYDRDSFVDATASPKDTAGLYFHKQLDAYYDTAWAVSLDFFSRPQLYTSVRSVDQAATDTDEDRELKVAEGDTGGLGRKRDRSDVVRTLARLRARCG